MESFKIARTNMVKGQILPSGVENIALIDTLTTIPKHIFTQEKQIGIAYIDNILFVDEVRYILSPMIFAKMVDALALKGDESVLDIACATGYSSAIFANLCKKVFAIESQESLASKVRLNLNKLDIANVIIISNNLSQGNQEGAPYDVIFINGAVKKIPENLFNQLAENGKLIALINKSFNYGTVTLFTKTKNEVNINISEIFDANLPIIKDF